MNILAVIPARGGSKGIPRKNVRLIAGKPLISYSIECALNSKYNLDIVVSTDDEEIARIAELNNVQVINRPETLASDKITLDPVIYHAMSTLESDNQKKYDIVVTMQPTSPLLSNKTLDNAITYFIDKDFDTVISGVNKPHLSWKEDDKGVSPNYIKRLNRQQLPKHLEETGAFVITKKEFVQENNRFGNIISVFELSEREAIDVDTAQDWWIAEKELSKKMILIRTEGYADIGLGHIYRGLLLAYNFIEHDIRFVISSQSDLGIEKIKDSHFVYDIINNENEIIDIIQDNNADILINDILDTTKEYIELCKSTGVKVINFEDLGEGARYADIVINDLYEKSNDYKNHYWGSDYYCIRDEFLLSKPAKFNNEVKEILVLFGGTDPCDLTFKTLNAINKLPYKDINYTFILGMGYKRTEEFFTEANKYNININIVRNVKRMTEYMQKADIALSSQGRTMLELASMEVPTILLAQNERELNHTFGYLENGFLNLGLGSNVNEDTIKETLLWLIKSSQIRWQMTEQMKKKDLKTGLKRVKNLILYQNV